MTLSSVEPSIQHDQLYDCCAWYDWLAEQKKKGISLQDRANQLSAWESPIAHLRRAELLEGAGRMDEALPHLRLCLRSTRPALRAHALALLVFSERHSRTTEAARTMDQIRPAVATLEKYLRLVEAAEPQDDFDAETQIILKYNLCRLYSDAGDYKTSLLHAGEAIYLSLPLQTPRLTAAIRMSYAGAALLLGQLQTARQTYQSVIDASPSDSPPGRLSRLNMAEIHMMAGDLLAAETMAVNLVSEYPDSAPVRVNLQYIRALSGVLDPHEEIQTYSELSRALINAGLQSLVQFTNSGHRESLNKVLEHFKAIPHVPARWNCVVAWAQGKAFLHLGQVYLAAQRVNLCPPQFPLIEILTLGLKIEIALHVNGVDLGSPANMCQQVQTIFQQASSPSARQGLASALAYWHPTAAAFCALSPYSIPELVDIAMPSIFTDGRPIQVHGQSIPTRLPFLQITLEAFGLSSTVDRDQSSERERIVSALTVPWGDGYRQLPVVPPALLIFNYLRMAEQHGELWRMAARELAQSHGTVPKTFGSNLRDERAALDGWLKSVLAGTLTASDFLTKVRIAGNGGTGRVQ